jgi:hypothetical protein
MPVLRTKTERGGIKRNIGGFFPTYIDHYLTLWSLANGVTKSSVMLSLLEEWVASNRAKKSEKQLMEKIIQRVSSQWKIEKAKPNKPLFEVYIEDVRIELLSRGLSEENVDKILKAIQK